MIIIRVIKSLKGRRAVVVRGYSLKFVADKGKTEPAMQCRAFNTRRINLFISQPKIFNAEDVGFGVFGELARRHDYLNDQPSDRGDLCADAVRSFTRDVVNPSCRRALLMLFLRSFRSQ